MNEANNIDDTSVKNIHSFSFDTQLWWSVHWQVTKESWTLHTCLWPGVHWRHRVLMFLSEKILMSVRSKTSADVHPGPRLSLTFHSITDTCQHLAHIQRLLKAKRLQRLLETRGYIGYKRPWIPCRYIDSVAWRMCCAGIQIRYVHSIYLPTNHRCGLRVQILLQSMYEDVGIKNIKCMNSIPDLCWGKQV